MRRVIPGDTMSTIQENATGSPVNCEQNADCSLFRKKKQPVSAPTERRDTSKNSLAAVYTIAQRLQFQRGKLQTQWSERLLEVGEHDVPKQI